MSYNFKFFVLSSFKQYLPISLGTIILQRFIINLKNIVATQVFILPETLTETGKKDRAGHLPSISSWSELGLPVLTEGCLTDHCLADQSSHFETVWIEFADSYIYRYMCQLNAITEYLNRNKEDNKKPPCCFTCKKPIWIMTWWEPGPCLTLMLFWWNSSPDELKWTWWCSVVSSPWSVAIAVLQIQVAQWLSTFQTWIGPPGRNSLADSEYIGFTYVAGQASRRDQLQAMQFPGDISLINGKTAAFIERLRKLGYQVQIKTEWLQGH